MVYEDGGQGTVAGQLLGSTDALEKENNKFRSSVTNLKQSRGTPWRC